MLLAAAILIAAPNPDIVPLKEKPSRAFSVVLPSETWQAVGSTFAIPHAGGEGFAVRPAGEGLEIDTDGDGAFDRVVEGVLDEDTGVRSGYTVLVGERASGTRLRYGLRLRNEGKGWQWSVGGSVTGRIGDLKVAVIDMDGDGVYGEIGQDALVLGSSENAAYLSETLVVGETVHSLTVARDGSQLTLGAYDGPLGVLEVTAGLEADARLLKAIVRSVDGKHSFDLARLGEEPRLPIGRYRLHGALLGLGDARVDVLEGRMRPIEVTASADTTLAWGGPTKAEFEFERAGGEVAFDPNRVWWYGAAGEEYRGWAPIGKSPEFTIKERKLGTELKKALFPGSC